MTDRSKFERQCKTPMRDHVTRFWNILETEQYVRVLIDMQRATEGGHYWDSSSFGDDCAKAFVADRQRMSAENARLREALKRCVTVLGGEAMSKSELIAALETASAALTQSQE